MLTVSKERWLARLSFLLMAGALYLLIEFAGLLSFALIGFALLGICVTVACAYWFISHRGPVRWAALAVVVLAPVAVNVLFARHGVLWVALAVVVLLVAAVAVARQAMGPPGRQASGPPGRQASGPPGRQASAQRPGRLRCCGSLRFLRCLVRQVRDNRFRGQAFLRLPSAGSRSDGGTPVCSASRLASRLRRRAR